MWKRLKRVGAYIINTFEAVSDWLKRSYVAAVEAIAYHIPFLSVSRISKIVHGIGQMFNFVIGVLLLPVMIPVLLIAAPILFFDLHNSFSRVVSNAAFKIYSMLFPNAASAATEKYEKQRGLQLLNHFTNPDSKDKMDFNNDDMRILINALQDNKDNIKYLNMHGCRIGAKVVELCEAIKQIKTLEYLNLSYNRIDDAGVNAIANLLNANSNIKTLKLTGNHISDVGAITLVNAIRAYGKLEVLDLKYNNIGFNAFNQIRDALFECQSLASFDLYPKHSVAAPQAGLSVLDKKIVKEAYVLPPNAITPEFLSYMYNSKHAIELSIQGPDMLQQVPLSHIDGILVNNTSLTELSFFYTSIKNDRIEILANDLHTNKTLRSLEVYDHIYGNITDKGAKALAVALRNNNTLKNLSLMGSGIDTQGALDIAEAISQNTTLESLSLHSSKFCRYSLNPGSIALQDAVKASNSKRQGLCFAFTALLREKDNKKTIHKDLIRNFLLPMLGRFSAEKLTLEL